jgi:hypothetical protein
MSDLLIQINFEIKILKKFKIVADLVATSD